MDRLSTRNKENFNSRLGPACARKVFRNGSTMSKNVDIEKHKRTERMSISHD